LDALMSGVDAAHEGMHDMCEEAGTPRAWVASLIGCFVWSRIMDRLADLGHTVFPDDMPAEA
jgi:hypothetical protein